jgi:hypothetical protein
VAPAVGDKETRCLAKMQWSEQLSILSDGLEKKNTKIEIKKITKSENSEIQEGLILLSQINPVPKHGKYYPESEKCYPQSSYTWNVSNS